MAETVNITKVTGSPHTWSSFGFTWGSDLANSKTWGTAYPFVYDCEADIDIYLSDNKKRDFMKRILSSISVSETYVDFISFMLKVIESIQASDVFCKQYDRLFSENISFVDKTNRTAGKIISENISVEEACKQLIAFTRKFLEDIAMSESYAKDVGIKKSESTSLSDRKYIDIKHILKDSISTTDNFKRNIKFKRLYAEYISVVDNLAKSIGISKKEAFSLVGMYLKHANAIISDIVIEQRDMTLDQFVANISTPVGYDSFINFIPGEYEYQNAIIQIILETVSTNTTVPQITDWVYNIDIPDTIDRGSATLVANTPITIAFTRKYYHTPEVNVTLRGGTNISSVPQITDITETNFTVVSTDNITISWTAVGY